MSQIPIESYNEMINVETEKASFNDYMNDLLAYYYDNDNRKLFKFMMECFELKDKFSIPTTKLIEFNLIRSTRSGYMRQRLIDIGLVEDIDFIQVPVVETLFTGEIDHMFELTGDAFLKLVEVHLPAKLSEYHYFIQIAIINYIQYEHMKDVHDNEKSEEDTSESESSDDGESDSSEDDFIPDCIKQQRDFYNNKLNHIDEYTVNNWLIVNNLEQYIMNFIQYMKMFTFVSFLLHICYIFNLNPDTLWPILVWIYHFIIKLINNGTEWAITLYDN